MADYGAVAAAPLQEQRNAARVPAPRALIAATLCCAALALVAVGVLHQVCRTAIAGMLREVAAAVDAWDRCFPDFFLVVFWP
eukprot:721719-Rhodomonas_salina.1